MILTNKTSIINKLKQKTIAIIPTDTIYGLVTYCQNQAEIKKIYQLKKRSLKKAPIILVANWKQAASLVVVNNEMIEWHNQQSVPTTLILKKKHPNAFKNTIWTTPYLAIRVVKWKWLQTILLATGPLIATSCNYNQKPPINDLDSVQKWENKVDFIVLKSPRKQNASRIYDWDKKTFIR